MCADPLAVGGQKGKLILKDHLAVVKQAADQGRLAIIHRATGNEPQQRFVLMLEQIGFDVLRNEVMGLVRGLCRRAAHQKYPACFFNSIDAL